MNTTAMGEEGPLGILYYSKDRATYGKGAKNVYHVPSFTTTDVFIAKRAMNQLPTSGAPYNADIFHDDASSNQFDFPTNQLLAADTSQFPGMFPPPPPTTTFTIPLAFFANNVSNQVNLLSFGGISYVQPATNLLALVQENKPLPPSASYQSSSGDPTKGTKGFNTLIFSSSDVVQIVLNNYDGGEHPIHIHGRRFYVLGRGDYNAGEYNATASSNLLNTVNPILRDTVTVNPTSWIVLQLADKVSERASELPLPSL